MPTPRQRLAISAAASVSRSPIVAGRSNCSRRAQTGLQSANLGSREVQMSDAGSQVPETLDTPSIDLWKFFEERGAEQKESLFKLITWIIGFAAVVLCFAIK
jgi:hypothetical protein